MRILLTGASGYIGLHVLRELLADGHEVTALVRSPGKLGPFVNMPGLRVVSADLEQEVLVDQTLQGHQICVHAALLWGEPGTELDLRDTVVAARLFDAAGRAHVACCLFISSAAVHRPFTGEMSEDAPLSTTDLYGATKAAGELFLRAACAQHHMTGVVVRLGPVVGPPAFASGSFRTDRRLAAMVTAAMDGRPIEVVGRDGRQLSDVAAVARAIRLMTAASNPHPTYICVDQAVLTWEWMARQVVACLDSRSEVRVLSQMSKGQMPRFRTERIEQLLGGPAVARDALLAHIHYLAAVSR